MSDSVPSPAFISACALRYEPFKFKRLVPTVQMSSVTPVAICGTFRFTVPDSARIPPAFTVNRVVSGALAKVLSEPPLRNVSVFTAELALRDCWLAKPAFTVVVAPDNPIASGCNSVSGLSGRRKFPVMSLVRNPLPRPVTDESPRTSGRTDIVIVLLAPPPCVAGTVKVESVSAPVLAAAEPPVTVPKLKLSARIKSEEVADCPPMAASARVTPGVPAAFNVMIPPPSPGVSVCTASRTAVEPLPRITSSPPCGCSVVVAPVATVPLPNRKFTALEVLSRSSVAPFWKL